MSLHTAYSWPCGDSETETRAFYHRLTTGHAAGEAFPFSRYQIGLARGSYTWFVAVLVLTDASGDDSLYSSKELAHGFDVVEWWVPPLDLDFQIQQHVLFHDSSFEKWAA